MSNCSINVCWKTSKQTEKENKGKTQITSNKNEREVRYHKPYRDEMDIYAHKFYILSKMDQFLLSYKPTKYTKEQIDNFTLLYVF